MPMLASGTARRISSCGVMAASDRAGSAGRLGCLRSHNRASELESLEEEPRRMALRTLLIDVPAWLRRLRNRSLGLVVFVRQDLVRAAIKQNLGQFLDRYAPTNSAGTPKTRLDSRCGLRRVPTLLGRQDVQLRT